jgi:hypothetical protein
MAIDKERISTRAAYGVLVGVIILSFALGIAVWQGFNMKWYAMPLTIFIAIGVFAMAISVTKSTVMDIIPSEQSYYFVVGYILTLIGVMGLVWMTTNIEGWILAVIFIVMIGLLVIIRSVSNKG